MRRGCRGIFMKPPFRVPDATYRVQLHAGFTFEQLAAIIPYLHEIGISDVYASPIFRAAPGSTHGYDVCDQNEINPELGGAEGLAKVSGLLRERGMGLLLDFVSNHMGIQGPYNWRWLDVLQNGPLSRYASFFDIQWNPRSALLQERIMVPVLHDFYGRVLEEGGLQLRFDQNALWVFYGEVRFPLSLDSYGTVLDRLAWFKNPGTPVAQQLEQMANRFRIHPDPIEGESLQAMDQRRGKLDLLRDDFLRLLDGENLRDDLQAVLKALNGNRGDAASFDNLHQILEAQHYRLAFWKAGSQEINYRRFFAVDSLVGVQMERQGVFDDTHRLLRELLANGTATGVRIDHIDGLWDPAEYLERLAGLSPDAEKPAYTLVEKILTERETLPPDWQVHGTSGYEFAGSLINLLIDGRQGDAFSRIYREFSGINLDPHEQVYELKLFIMEELFPNAVEGLAEELERRVNTDRRWRDWTTNDLRLALSRIIACLSVYRTYRRPGQPMSATDIAVVERAAAAAVRRNTASDPLAIHFVRDVWIGKYPDQLAAENSTPNWADEWVCTLQQYTGAIMAKSVEDTFYYRYVRFFGANEVGHHPAEFGLPVAAFHEENARRLAHWPACLLGTSTHDTKLSEDARARLLALSELPERWGELLPQWREANRGFKERLGVVHAPDANEEYLFYQILLAAWPLQEGQVDDVFRERIRDYMRKALSESKANTNWALPNEPWLRATNEFIEAVLDPRRAGEFWKTFVPFAGELAWRGALFSLAQVALKLTCPGVPDVYQGCDLWDFSLVDPDNRRPVDYAARAAALRDLDAAGVPPLLATWRDGRIKLHLTRCLLRYRREHPVLFRKGAYIPLEIAGEQAGRFVAFLRAHEGEHLLVVVAIRLGEEVDLAALGRGIHLALPGGTPGEWTNLLNSAAVKLDGNRIEVSEALAGFPVAVLRSR
jgi:(1->4)-alpha-D-glucan 1-alpha-D-glucosylmutase